MELRQIEHFVAVVEEQHFTRAARRCNLSQSALSASIRSLERELDAPLFVRSTRHVELSEAGQALLEKARLVLRAVADAQDAVSATRNRLAGSLSVGGIQTTGVLDQAKLLAQFHTQHPEVEIRYTTGTSLALIDEIRAGHLDLAFISVPPKRVTGVVIQPLATYPMMLVCHQDHPLASRETVDLDMLGNETFVGGPHRSIANDSIARVYRVAGTENRLLFHVNDAASMLEFAANGLGVTLLPSHLLDPRLPLVAVPLSDPAMIWTIGVAAAPSEKRSRATRILLDLLDSFGEP